MRRGKPRNAGKPLDPGFLAGLLGYRLRRAQLAVFRHFAEHLGAWSITPGQIGVLALIAANPGISQAALAKAIGIERSSLGEVIKRLDARGFLSREPTPADRRSHALALSADGAGFLANVRLDIAEHERESVRALSAEETDTLLDLLGKIADGLNNSNAVQATPSRNRKNRRANS